MEKKSAPLRVGTAGIKRKNANHYTTSAKLSNKEYF